MFRKLLVVSSLVVLAISAASALLPAQNTSQAYVYVVSSSTNGNQLYGYSALANGALVTISGSPFPDNVGYVAANSRWLFAVGSDLNSINSYSIASNGSLTLAKTYTISNMGGGLINLFLDHTGQSLYGDYYTVNNEYLQYSINQSTGQLTYLTGLGGGPEIGSVLSFIGDNRYAYSSSCYIFNPDVYGVQRNVQGELSLLNINPSMPTPPPGDFYCPVGAAADSTNHLAIAVQPNGSNGPAGPYQLATYTATSTGNLTTNSTYQNMPSTQVGTVIDYWMSPNGAYLAVGGTAGLQVFRFNGGNPITTLTGLLTPNEVDQVFWDNANHLYAISQPTGKLYVFTVTASGATQAPGSPHSIRTPVSMVVLPR